MAACSINRLGAGKDYSEGMRFCALLLLMAAPSFAEGEKVGLVKLNQAISETRDGETARNYLHAQFDPVMARLRSEELGLKGERDRLALNRQSSLEWFRGVAAPIENWRARSITRPRPTAVIKKTRGRRRRTSSSVFSAQSAGG